MKEHTYSTEVAAKAARRRMISEGWMVSLIAYDPARDLYVFDASAPYG